jgi:hypothetical protein
MESLEPWPKRTVPNRSNRKVVSALAFGFACAALWVAGAAQANPIRRDENSQIIPPWPEGMPMSPSQSRLDPLPGPQRPAWQRMQRIVFAFDQPLQRLVVYDAALSKACRSGRFQQRIPWLHRAFGPGERPLGVGFGRLSANLYDPDQRRKVEQVYFFANQDAGRCMVYVAALRDVQRYFIGP